MGKLETVIETRSPALLDFDNPGAPKHSKADLAGGMIMKQDGAKP